jgi:hypothetical protein
LIRRLVWRIVIAFLLILFSVVGMTHAQESTLPFEVSNPKHKKWPEAQAARIYTWACDLLARSIRPEKPPQLHPKFVWCWVRMGTSTCATQTPPRFT